MVGVERSTHGFLCAPVVDSLLAETKIGGDVLYGLTGFEQVEHLSAKSSRILTHHEFLSVDSPPQFHQTDSKKPRAVHHPIFRRK